MLKKGESSFPECNQTKLLFLILSFKYESVVLSMCSFGFTHKHKLNNI